MNNKFKRNIETKNYSNYFYVIFGDKLVQDGDFFPLDAVQKAPVIRFDRMGYANRGKFHTVVIVDPDAPIGFHIHLALYDIEGDNISRAKTFYSYSTPRPPFGTGPAGDGKHKYYCILYEQSEKIGKQLEPIDRGFKTYKDFTKMLGVGLNPKAAKYFVCQAGVFI